MLMGEVGGVLGLDSEGASVAIDVAFCPDATAVAEADALTGPAADDVDGRLVFVPAW